ncbi:chromate efflux transporter [Nesterenkonia sp. HG001]|uniref:chromate efflux transporter n=1 Tax=Nesterenkonia sp. HG001 TaxID=2983207 RepID=UPI002AC3A562|nr:chromate efflux transporter [Nesterenkonia sp. HG001]MDZ5077823.1 chromate efflux transporter [Nesterenkonia sp. HG001]
MSHVHHPSVPARGHDGSVAEVFLIFLRLGLTSFGGPVAHLAYFREAFVERRRWLSEKAYADLVALCQFLPGPASSQVGMALGLQRAGWGGMCAAWFAFTLPSVLLLVAFAYGVATLGDLSDAGWIHGLKAAAVGVVAHAVLGMAKTLTPDAPRASIAAGAMITVVLVPQPFVQVGAIAVAGLVGLLWLRPETPQPRDEDTFTVKVSKKVAAGALILFGALLVGLPLLVASAGSAAWHGAAQLVDLFYRAGSLVFGGGHVVLPLLEAEMVGPGLVDSEVFLAGYGAAQAVPGPLFTFAGYLGASTTEGPGGAAGALIAVGAIFLPAALLVIGALPFWEALRGAPLARRALTGVNAGVVGILAAALYDPVFTAGVLDVGLVALAVAVASFVALNSWKVPAWAVVIGAGLLGWIVL